MTSPEEVYELGKARKWERVRELFEADSMSVPPRHVGGKAVRYVKPSSGWTLLHQAAYFGDESAARLCIKYGAHVNCLNKERKTPASVAATNNHGALRELLERLAGSSSGSGLWAPSDDPALFASSSKWHPHLERRAKHAFNVAYGGGTVRIAAGERYFVDEGERVLVGWHGTYDPPSGMDGESCLR